MGRTFGSGLGGLESSQTEKLGASNPVPEVVRLVGWLIGWLVGWMAG